MVKLTLLHSEPDYNCPEKNKNYGRGRGLERKRNVKSWEACSALCSKRSDCKYWTWHHDRAGQYSHICKTMTTLQYEREDRNSVSGTRACRPDIQGKIRHCFWKGDQIVWVGLTTRKYLGSKAYILKLNPLIPILLVKEERLFLGWMRIGWWW